MKLAIVGGRAFSDYELLKSWIQFFLNDTDNLIIISGGAKGADGLGKQFAAEFGLEYIEFPANWNKHGKAAGFIRNQQIVDACDMVLAFWDGKSQGTADTIEKAKRAKKPTFIVYF